MHDLNISIRLADLRDKDILYEWVNAKDSLCFKIETEDKISYKKHEKWFNQRLSDRNTYIWIIEKQNLSIGQLRFQKKEKDCYDVDIYIERKMRKQGLALKALNLAIASTKRKTLRAVVKKNNHNSFLFFSKAGFKIYAENNEYWELIKN